METKSIIICGILALATILLGLFRLWWLRKCYDKARAEKKDVLQSEQIAIADKQRKTYDKARATTWKYMGIALAVIAILGTAVWGFNRIAQAQKAEKKLVNIEECYEESSSWLDYLAIYFDKEKAFRYYGKKVTKAYQEAQAEYDIVQKNLQKAQAENNETEIVIQKALLQDVQNVLNKAEQNKKDFSSFPEKWRLNSNFNWWILAEIICGAFLFYLLRTKKKNGWLFSMFFISAFFLIGCLIAGFFISPIFTLRDILFWLIWGIDAFLLISIFQNKE